MPKSGIFSLANVYIKIEEKEKSFTSFETLWVVHCYLIIMLRTSEANFNFGPRTFTIMS